LNAIAIYDRQTFISIGIVDITARKLTLTTFSPLIQGL
jgi:hypothetical protein